MMDYLRQAGPLSLPILLLGVAALALSAAHYSTLGPRHRALAVGTTLTTILLGLLGTTIGFQQSLRHLPELVPEKRWLVQIGMLESLNSLVLSLVFALLATVLLTFAAARGTRTTASDPLPLEATSGNA